MLGSDRWTKENGAEGASACLILGTYQDGKHLDLNGDLVGCTGVSMGFKADLMGFTKLDIPTHGLGTCNLSFVSPGNHAVASAWFPLLFHLPCLEFGPCLAGPARGWSFLSFKAICSLWCHIVCSWQRHRYFHGLLRGTIYLAFFLLRFFRFLRPLYCVVFLLLCCFAFCLFVFRFFASTFLCCFCVSVFLLLCFFASVFLFICFVFSLF